MRFVSLSLRFCAVLLVASSLLAQYTSQQISGTVRDGSGAVVVGASITAIQQETGLTRQATSAENGYFAVSSIPIGDYTIDVEAPGFKRYRQTGIILSVNSKVTADVALSVGEVTESVTVSADAAMIETSTGEVGRLITGEQATKIQLNGRNFAQLLALLPGVSTTNRSSFDLFGGFGSNMSAQSINGGRTYTTSWNIDGADNKDNGGGGNNFVNVNPDAIAEFKVMTSNYSAEYGQNAGAVVNVALKSGTRDFHGSLYEFVRNDAFDAFAFRAATKQKLRWNNFGGSIGGPVFIPGKFNTDRSKLFFFAGAEFKRLRRDSPVLWNIPTVEQRNGNFSGLPQAQWPRDPATNPRVPFANGIIPQGRFSPNGKALVDMYPAPNFAGGGGNFNFQPPQPLDADQYITKGDYYMDNKNQFAVHWTRDMYDSLQNTTNQALFDRIIPGLNTSAKWTHIANATTVNTFQFTYTGNVIRQENFRPNPIFGSSYQRADLGVNYPMLFGNQTAVPNLAISGFNALNTQPLTWNNFNRVFQWKNDFSKVFGSHNMKFGFLGMRSRKNQDNQPAINGSVNFSPGHPMHSGNALADALLGNFNNYTEASAGREGWFRFTQFEMYAQDNWRVNQRLTLDLGLRWMIMQPQYAALQNAVVFNPRFYDPAKAPVVQRNGQIVPGTGDPINGLVVGGSEYPEAFQQRFPQHTEDVYQRLLRGLPKEISPWQSGLLGPRLGFAFDVTGKQNTVVRGGYGLFYERIQGNFVFGRVNNPPFIQESQVFFANISNPAGGTRQTVPSTVSSYDIDVKIPTVNNYSLGIQHKLSSTMMVDVAFVGSGGWNQYRQVNLNQLQVGTLQQNPGVNTNALRPYNGYANINHYITGSNFNYNSLQAQWRKSFDAGGLLNVAYTWSKAITDASDWGETAMDSYDFKRDRGLASYDRRQVFVLNYIYPLPFWREQNSWYKVAFGGWQLSGVTTIQSGRPLNIGIQGDVAGIGQGGQRPNLVGDAYAGGGTSNAWFNTAAFAVPAAGTFGNLGRNAITGPGTNNWDVSLQKNFRFQESKNLEFRLEMYNAPNHFSYFGVATTVGANNFGQVTSANDPRTLQFGLRFEF
ncbi:MAG: carboxypeptidase regulatory-like domain-containing protein [Bryobacterales bacterium]|nr:carboxypeptidase regulatory-like domain-containing protein [Bryobacterales bacterium]